MKKIYQIFLLFFGISLLAILILAAPMAFQGNVLLWTVAVFVFCAAVLWLLRRKSDFFTEKRCTWIAFILLAGLLCMQIVRCVQNPYRPLKGDYEAIYTAVREVVEFGKLTDSNLYFLWYKHQRLTMIVYAVVNYIAIKLGSPVNSVNLIVSTIFNSVLCCAGGGLLYFGAKKISGARTALFTLLLFCLNNSYKGSNQYLYGHALSVFFVCMVLFLYTSCIRAANRRAESILLFVWGISIAVARSIEGIIALSIVAAVIYLIITSKTARGFVRRGLLVLAGFVIAIFMIEAYYRISGVFDFTNAENEAFPLTHWIMIGLNEDGHYSEDDFQAMIHLPTKEEKRAYAASQIKERLASRSAGELYKLGKLKESDMWAGAAYGYNLSPADYVFQRSYKLLLYCLIAVSLLKELSIWKKRECAGIGPYAFGYIWMFGIFLFALLWEASAVYLFSSMPLIIFLAGGGADALLCYQKRAETKGELADGLSSDQSK